MSLDQEIQEKKKEISTDGYPMSIGELMSLYRDGEMDAHPEFQRIFRWTEIQKTKLIESILLGIPIPSIFVSQREDGVWDVVDGLQRLSTIFEFVGILKDEEGNLIPPSTLIGTEYLPSLEGKKWDNPESPEHSFDANLRMTFKREKIDIKIVKRESDKSVKYELFQRLNTLGTKLSDQEVRNCLLVMINKDFYRWLKDLAEYEPYLNTLILTDKALDEKYNMELALRYLIFKNFDSALIKNSNEISDYITDKMLEITDDFDFEKEKTEFKRTFDILNHSMSELTFKRFNPVKEKFEGKFLLSAFEAISVGLGSSLERFSGLNLDDSTAELVRDKIIKLWNDPDFLGKTGSGVRANFRIPVIVPKGKEIFSE